MLQSFNKLHCGCSTLCVCVVHACMCVCVHACIHFALCVPAYMFEGMGEGVGMCVYVLHLA